MSDLREFFSLLAIQRIFSTAPRIACNLLKMKDSAEAIFKADKGSLRPFFGNHFAAWESFQKFNDWKQVERDHKKICELGAHIIGVGSPHYPKCLRDIYDPPPVIIARGDNLDTLNAPAVAIVGARKSSAQGKNVAFEMAEHLSFAGFVVISGMAWGIDSAAHRGAVSAGGGTVAVFGCGPDIIYPPWNLKLSQEIVETGGLLVSEFPPGFTPMPYNFPQRNRIISGMSIATVVIEAAEKSGSLITAQFALEQGREVFACPGQAGTASGRGTNRLLRDGAALVENGEDVLNLLAAHMPPRDKTKKTGLFGIDVDKDSTILEVIREKGIASADEIILASKETAGRALETLTKLVCAGMIEELPGHRFKVKGC